MSNQGIRGYYQLTKTIKEQLLSDTYIKTVTTGNLSDINLRKQDIFPLAHIIVNNVIIGEQTLRFNISVLAMDIVNQAKTETTDLFTGNSNEQDRLNTQLGVINKLVQNLGRGDLYTDGYQIEGEPNCDPFYDRFESELAGWTVTLDINLYNDITIC